MGTLAGVAEFPGRFDECMTITGRTRALLSGRLWHSRRQWRGRRQRGIPRSHGGRRCCGFECQVVNLRRSANWSRGLSIALLFVPYPCVGSPTLQKETGIMAFIRR